MKRREFLVGAAAANINLEFGPQNILAADA
jgi:hypothetical protein